VRAVSHRDSLVSMADEPALAYATREPVTLPAETEIAEAFHRMHASGLTLLPVVDEGRLAGVVLRVDLMHAMLLDVAHAVEEE
jgi:CBS domain-containing protein